MLDVGRQVAVTVVSTQNNASYFTAALNIDGAGQTVQWMGNTTPSAGSASGVDVYFFTVIKTAATPTYLVLGQQNGSA